MDDDGPLPETLEQCFVQLALEFSEEGLSAFRETPRSDLAKYHFGLGASMRNVWRLWRPGPLVSDLNARGIWHPDEMSAFIILSYHDRLNSYAPETDARGFSEADT